MTVKKACSQLNMSTRDFTEMIGASEGTVRNWSSAGTLPRWAKKSIEVAIELEHCKERISRLVDALSIISNGEVPQKAR